VRALRCGCLTAVAEPRHSDDEVAHAFLGNDRREQLVNWFAIAGCAGELVAPNTLISELFDQDRLGPLHVLQEVLVRLFEPSNDLRRAIAPVEARRAVGYAMALLIVSAARA
jgi:hypothetical protein